MIAQLRIGLAVLGFVAALGGVIREDRRLVWVAIVLLGGAFLIRLYLRARPPESRSSLSRRSDPLRVELVMRGAGRVPGCSG